MRLPWARAAAVGATAASFGVGAWIASACVPDLQTVQLTARPASPLCGDGFIDRDAGEACDPGEAGAVGCTSTCQIECGDAGFVDPATEHCYFVPSDPQRDYPNASMDCEMAAAHAVTFGSPREFDLVAAWAETKLPGIWIGFVKSSDSPGYAADSPQDEPGWESTNCTGCYAATNATGGIDRSALFDAATSTDCVMAPDVPHLGDAPWQEWPCDPTSTGPRTVCERAPPGLSSEPCNGAFCVDLAFTHGTKSYLLFAQPTGPDDAAALCAQFPGGLLVTLDSPEEREELWAEIAGVDPSITQVWIGLAQDGDAGGAWTWSDGTPLGLDGGPPLPWGDKQPVDGGGTRAYLQRLPTEDVVDNQLAQNFNHTPPMADAAVPIALPFVCQIPPGGDAGHD